MPRQARLDIAGALHHIMIRGINKSAVFKSKKDKLHFREKLGENILRAGCRVYAWVIMDNHVHILFKSGREGISTVMRKLLTWYAQDYNRRHNRSGYGFENRYKSILCDEEKYLLSLVRYIHLNPIRAKSIFDMDQLDAYPWSGHEAIIGRKQYSWMDTETVLGYFGKSRNKAINVYRHYVVDGISQPTIQEFNGGGLIRSHGGWSEVIAMRRKGEREEADERILGEGDFVQEILTEAEKQVAAL